VKKYSRRTILTLVAGTSAASLTTAAGALPADPVYAAIERHETTGAVLNAAVTVRSGFPDLHMNDEQQRQLKRLERSDRRCLGALRANWHRPDLHRTDHACRHRRRHSIYSNPGAQRRYLYAAWNRFRI